MNPGLRTIADVAFAVRECPRLRHPPRRCGPSGDTPGPLRHGWRFMGRPGGLQGLAVTAPAARRRAARREGCQARRG